MRTMCDFQNRSNQLWKRDRAMNARAMNEIDTASIDIEIEAQIRTSILANRERTIPLGEW